MSILLSKSAVAGICLFSALVSSGTDTTSLPEITYTDQSPFMNGKRVECVWEKADRMSGFTIPAKFARATLESECSMLFDDENLYFSLKAFTGNLKTMGKKSENVFSDNHFELFFMPDESIGDYIQAAVSRFGKIYTGKATKVKRMESAIPGFHASVEEGRSFWAVNITVPLKSLGMTAPEKGTPHKVRFNICRNDVTLPDIKSEKSSYAVLDIDFNYHQVEKWTSALLVRTPGKGRAITAESTQRQVNLLPNSEFNIASDGMPVGWILNSLDIARVETMEFSGQWTIRANDNAYQVMTVRVPNTEADKSYTLRIKARQFGGQNFFGVVQLSSAANGKFKETDYTVWKMPLTNEFHEYSIPLKARKNLIMLSFYRFGPKQKTSGVDFDSVQLFKGEIPSFEIRKIERPELKQAVQGTETPIMPNLYGKNSEKLRVLAICKELVSVRELMEIFAGMNVEFDFLTTTGENSDLYYAETPSDTLLKRLQQSEYDVYMVGSNVSWIGNGLAAMILKNIEKGAGLVISNASKFGHFDAFLKKYPLKANAHDSCLAQALPLEFFRAEGKNVGKTSESMGGKGRIVLLQTTPRMMFQILQLPDDYADKKFPCEAFVNAWLAKVILYAANKNGSRIASVAASENKVTVHCMNPPEKASVVWEFLNKNGEKLSGGTETLSSGVVSLSLPEMTMTGNHLLVFWLKDKNGNVLDYGTRIFRKEGPSITRLEDLKKFYRGTDHAQIAVSWIPVSGKMNFSWTLEDFAGRILEKGSVNAAEKVILDIPLKALHTNFACVRVAMKQNGLVLDERSLPVYVQDRDRLRLLDDFTLSVWPQDDCISGNYMESIVRQLQNVGIRCYNFTLYSNPYFLRMGMGLGGGSNAGGGTIFLGWKQDTHVRKQQFNSAESREKIGKIVSESVRSRRQYGPLFYTLCDEPGLSRKGEGDELDSHPENLAEYRRRMEKKYGTIEKFNNVCSTNYKSFHELNHGLIADARKSGNFAEFIEWRNFNTDRWVEAIKFVADTAKANDPSSRQALSNTFGQCALTGDDYWKLLTKANLNASEEYTSMVYMGTFGTPIYDFDELYRSFRPDLRVWGYFGYVNGYERMMFQPWWFATHRYGGCTWFAVHSGLIRTLGLTSPWNLLDLPGNGLTKDASHLKDSLEKSNMLKGVGKLLLAYNWTPREIAVYYSQESMLTSFCLGKETKNGEILPSGPLHDFYYSRHNLRYLLEDLLFQYDFVAPEQIMAGKLHSYKMLFLPGIISLSDAEIKAFKEFAVNGGIIVSDFQPGIRNELGMKRPVLPMAGLENLFLTGKIFDDNDTAMKKTIFGLLRKADIKPIAECENILSFSGREGMHFTDGKMNLYSFLRNPIRAKEKNRQVLTLPSTGHLYDIVHGKYLGPVSKTTLLLTEDEPAALFGHYPYKITALCAEVPGKVAVGSDLPVNIKVEVSEGVPGKHVFHIELVPPGMEKTSVPFHLQRNVIAGNGKYTLVFQMAYNDPKGKWKLRVKDVMSGLTAEKTFILE